MRPLVATNNTVKAKDLALDLFKALNLSFDDIIFSSVTEFFKIKKKTYKK